MLSLIYLDPTTIPEGTSCWSSSFYKTKKWRLREIKLHGQGHRASQAGFEPDLIDCWAHVPNTVLCHCAHMCERECVLTWREMGVTGECEWIEGRRKKSIEKWNTQMQTKERRKKMGNRKWQEEAEEGGEEPCLLERPGQREGFPRVPIPLSCPAPPLGLFRCGLSPPTLPARQGSPRESAGVTQVDRVSLGAQPAWELHLKPASCPGWSWRASLGQHCTEGSRPAVGAPPLL